MSQISFKRALLIGQRTTQAPVANHIQDFRIKVFSCAKVSIGNAGIQWRVIRRLSCSSHFQSKFLSYIRPTVVEPKRMVPNLYSDINLYLPNVILVDPMKIFELIVSRWQILNPQFFDELVIYQRTTTNWPSFQTICQESMSDWKWMASKLMKHLSDCLKKIYLIE